MSILEIRQSGQATVDLLLDLGLPHYQHPQEHLGYKMLGRLPEHKAKHTRHQLLDTGKGRIEKNSTCVTRNFIFIVLSFTRINTSFIKI